ncbi:MAG TPA: hypothetical protein VFK44_01015 [Bacillales bacterium]|nr:hypothetical protein [Bacillales bacterium]
MDRLERIKERYHCCATCRHFRVENDDGNVTSRCARLGYETNPKWQFRCWNPKDRVRRQIAEARKSLRKR